MRPALLALILTSACTGEANHLGNPLTWPGQIIGGGIQNAIYNERRDRVDNFVYANYPALLADITAGGGPALTQAFDIARVPATDRPTRVEQLRGDQPLYQSSPAALTVALMVYGR